jgi:uncharacterized protein (DUF1778 family)
MATKTINREEARFNARLPREQKMLLEKAALIGGYRNLTDFIMLTAQEKAKEIIRENDVILATEKDCEIFFEAIMNPKEPNEKLKSAAQQYNKLVSK